MFTDNRECVFCGQYENPTNDEESRLDNPDNPENFYTVDGGDEMDIVHYECFDNW